LLQKSAARQGWGWRHGALLKIYKKVKYQNKTSSSLPPLDDPRMKTTKLLIIRTMAINWRGK
jgi:hypothetical protein